MKKGSFLTAAINCKSYQGLANAMRSADLDNDQRQKVTGFWKRYYEDGTLSRDEFTLEVCDVLGIPVPNLSQRRDMLTSPGFA